MPELPEVETVMKALEPKIKNKTIWGIQILAPKTIATDLKEFKEKILKTSITKLSRRGKFLLFHLSDGAFLIGHLKMEGKLFFYKKEEYKKSKYDRLLFEFMDHSLLVFNDVRRFGRFYYYPKGTPLKAISNLGIEANQLTPEEVLWILKKSKKPLKSLFLDQTKIAGIGNIYADEIAFACHLNPFLNANKQANKENAAAIAFQAKKILNQAIEDHGSTIRSYKASPEISGHFQTSLKVYNRVGKPCLVCGSKIMKRKAQDGRGTSYCPTCQHIGKVLGVAGGIAAGKTEASTFIVNRFKYGFINCDKVAKELYNDPSIVKKLKKIDGRCFHTDGTINKVLIKQRLINEPDFRRKWLGVLYPALNKKVLRLLNANSQENFVVEAAVLFKARINTFCDHILIMVTNQTYAHLLQRGDKDPKLTMRFNEINDWKKHLNQGTVLTSNGSLAQLKEKVLATVQSFQKSKKA